jgi:sugar lactone lactonase YvrE
MKAEPLTSAIAHHGEGAVWDDRTGQVLWVDMLAGRVLKTDPSDGVTTAVPVGSPIAACVRPTGTDALLVARRSDVCILAADGELRVLATLCEQPGIQLNEGGCDPLGRFIVGSLAEDERPGAGCLWQVEGNGRSRLLFDDVTISNGVAFSGDGGSMFYVDTATDRIDEYPYDVQTGELCPRRTFADIRALELTGNPDGICTDAEDGVWVALWEGRSVARIDSSGRVDAVIDVPTLNVTSCSFGGAELDTLFITTSAYDDPSPGAGVLYACKPGVKGRLAHPFRESVAE